MNHSDAPTGTPYDLAQEAARRLAELTGVERHDVALVLGSGWLPAVDALGEATAEIETTDLPGFSAAAVAGHSGKIRSVRSGRAQPAGLPLPHPLLRGPRRRGGRAPGAHGGRGRLLDDRADQRLRRPQRGLDARHAGPHQGPPQPHRDARPSSARTSSTSPTSTPPGLRALCKEVDETLDEGVYAQFPGPHYETPAEVRMAACSAPTWSACRPRSRRSRPARPAWRSSGISLVTNLAAGISDQPLDHQEVIEAGRAAAERMGSLLGRIVPRV